MTTSKWRRRALCWIACLAAVLFAATEARAWDNGVALTPPMGWNSWYTLGDTVSDARVREMADRLVSTGLAAHGFDTVIVDDSWQGQRDAKIPDPFVQLRRLHPTQSIGQTVVQPEVGWVSQLRPPQQLDRCPGRSGVGERVRQ